MSKTIALEYKNMMCTPEEFLQRLQRVDEGLSNLCQELESSSEVEETETITSEIQTMSLNSPSLNSLNIDSRVPLHRVLEIQRAVNTIHAEMAEINNLQLTPQGNLSSTIIDLFGRICGI